MTKLWQVYLGLIKIPTSHRGELISIQWLRGLAVMMVLVYHVEDVARLLPGFSEFKTFWTHLGYSAPDLFFVISGFIMSYVTFGLKFTPRRWLVSRFVRIYPLYMFFTFLAFVVWLTDPSMTMGSGNQTWASVIKSFVIWPQSNLPLIFVGWTVEHEIVFYAIVFCVATLGGNARTLVVTLGVLSALAAGRWFLRDDVPALNFWDYHFLSLFMIQFFIGASVFYLREQFQFLGHVAPAVIALALFFTGGWLAQSGSIDHETLSRVLFYGLSYGFLLLAAVNWETGLRQKKGDAYLPKRRPFLVRAGDASYSIYLIHPFCLSVGGKLLNIMNVEGVVAAAGVIMVGSFTLVCGLVFYEIVEKPLLQLMKVLTATKKSASNIALATKI